ncbi:MAG: protein kinase domain-containing protein [Hyphomicrobiales bacterium]
MGDDPTVTAFGPRSDEPPPGRPPSALLGRSIRHYSIEAELGRGGMGVVYLARDTLLDRKVALKVLPDELAADPRRLAAFRREAKLLAALNHANIATIYGIEETPSGGQAILLELLEGETLHARIRREPPSIEQALSICEQVAAALEAAHDHGVVHRDLKPSNVMVSPGGAAKVLDFGMASRERGFESTVVLAPPSESAAAEPHAANIAPPGGTPGYMSPERIRGEADDARGDVFAFGCLLFECMTRSPAFGGLLAHERIARTLTGSPDWSLWPRGAPGEARDLAARCLEPDPALRLVTMEEARHVLRTARGLGSPAGPPPSIPGLPRAATRFLGRSSEVAEVVRLLRRSSLLTLVGPGGCGKTRLAHEIARNAAASFGDGLCFVDLAPLTDGSRVPLAIATALGLRVPHGTELGDGLVGHLRKRAFLLVLDNCEHVLGACADLATPLMRGCDRLRILVTSREALRVPGEQEFPVPPLSLPEEGERDLVRLRRSDAVRLFEERAGLVLPGFRVEPADAPAIAGICRRLDGMPLAIELAAARLKIFAPAELHARLQTDLGVLDAGGPIADRTRRTLAGAIRWSYNHLVPRQQSTLRALSVFAGSLSLEAAEAVVGGSAEGFDTVDDLIELVNKSLVLVEHVPAAASRYRILETIREFARDELAREGEEPIRKARHAEHFLAWVEEIEPLLDGPDQIAWHDRLDRDRENLLAAAEYCESLPNGAEKALRLLSGLDRYWIRRGRFPLGHTALARALALPGADRATIHRARALCTQASISSMRGDPASAAQFRETAEIARSLGLRSLTARALNGLGVCAITDMHLNEARKYLEECLTLNQELGDETKATMARANLAVVAFLVKDYAAAHALFEACLESYRQLKNPGGELAALTGVSRSSVYLGDFERARRGLSRSVEMLDRASDTRNAATCLLTAGLLAVALEDFRNGARFLAASEAVRAAFAPNQTMSQGDREQQDPALARIREAIGQAELDAVWSEGRALDLKGALAALSTFLGPGYPSASSSGPPAP